MSLKARLKRLEHRGQMDTQRLYVIRQHEGENREQALSAYGLGQNESVICEYIPGPRSARYPDAEVVTGSELSAILRAIDGQTQRVRPCR